MKLCKIKQPFTIFLFSLFLTLAILVVANGDDNHNGEGEDEENGIFGEDGVKEMGTLAVGFLVIGFVYVGLRRSYVYSNRYLSNENYRNIKVRIGNVYRKSKSPLLNLHNITMIVATILAVIHGIYLGDDLEAIGLTGWIAAIMMITLSLSGIIIWLKFRPIWDYRTARTHIRFIHRQWLFTIIMIAALILHISILED